MKTEIYKPSKAPGKLLPLRFKFKVGDIVKIYMCRNISNTLIIAEDIIIHYGIILESKPIIIHTQSNRYAYAYKILPLITSEKCNYLLDEKGNHLFSYELVYPFDFEEEQHEE